MKLAYMVGALLFLGNCAPQHLYVAHESVLGINAKINQGRQTGQLLIGYDRDFATIIPTNVPVPGPAGVIGTDAMALVHCTQLEVDGIHLGIYSDFTATGDAAEIIAADPKKVQAATSCSQLEQGAVE